jgi:hypothetical protein
MCLVISLSSELFKAIYCTYTKIGIWNWLCGSVLRWLLPNHSEPICSQELEDGYVGGHNTYTPYQARPHQTWRQGSVILVYSTVRYLIQYETAFVLYIIIFCKTCNLRNYTVQYCGYRVLRCSLFFSVGIFYCTLYIYRTAAKTFCNVQRQL